MPRTPAFEHLRHGLARFLAVSCLAGLFALGLAPASMAAAPTLNISSPTNESVIRNTTPTFSGTTSVELIPTVLTEPVKVSVYRGEGTVGTEPVGEPIIAEQAPFTTEWIATVNAPLADGIYTAVAAQSEGGETGHSNAVSFTVSTPPPPHVAITYPANYSSADGESQLLTGSAGTAPHDLHEVTIELFSGSTVGASALAILHVHTSGATWSAVFGGLSPGTYTAQAVQYTDAGNVGTSAPDSFTLTVPPPLPVVPPSASFSWFPTAPVVGQSVALVSSSTDAASPLTSFAWDLAGNGQFSAGGPVLTTSFATAGNHVVRLQVTDARGVSGVATETIPVGRPPLRAMQPFPIVRIAGVQTGSGVRLSLVSVQAPVGSRVTVTCRGRGCRTKPQSRIASASKHTRHANSALLAFASFEREFRAGVTLEVRVGAAGEIGKYTLFAIHRHSLPTRVDSCLAALDPQPIACTP